jgi:hypothetical protein
MAEQAPKTRTPHAACAALRSATLHLILKRGFPRNLTRKTAQMRFTAAARLYQKNTWPVNFSYTNGLPIFQRLSASKFAVEKLRSD